MNNISPTPNGYNYNFNPKDFPEPSAPPFEELYFPEPSAPSFEEVYHDDPDSFAPFPSSPPQVASPSRLHPTTSGIAERIANFACTVLSEEPLAPTLYSFQRRQTETDASIIDELSKEGTEEAHAIQNILEANRLRKRILKRERNSRTCFARIKARIKRALGFNVPIKSAQQEDATKILQLITSLTDTTLKNRA